MKPEDGLEQMQELILEISEEMTDAEYREFLAQVRDDAQQRLDLL